MLKRILIGSIIFAIIFIADQYIKFIFVNGWTRDWECISLVLAYNYGVAFSMLSFLNEYLKYIQILFMLCGLLYLWLHKNIFKLYYLPISLILAGGISNIYDRFIHGGVVDYVYWHCGFDFAIFNLADVCIDTAIIWILILFYKEEHRKNKMNI